MTVLTYTEVTSVAGERLKSELQQILHEDEHVSRLTIKNADGLRLFDMPLAVKLVRVAMPPFLVAAVKISEISEIAVPAGDYQFRVERGMEFPSRPRPVL